MEDNYTIRFYTQDFLFFYHNETNTFSSPQSNLPYSHSHPHHEIIQLLEGDVDFMLDGNIYSLQAGDILLIRAGDYHTWKINSNIYKRRVIEFEESYLKILTDTAQELLSPYHVHSENFYPLISAPTVKTYHLDTIFDKIESTINDTNKTKSFIPIHIMALLVEINNILADNPKKKNNSTLHSITKIIKYIDDHISEKINLIDLEKYVNLSKYYIAHLFKKTMGVTIANYIIERKIRHAEQLIRQGVSPTQASMMVGYYNYSNFYENYKKITKMTPKNTKIQIPTSIE